MDGCAVHSGSWALTLSKDSVSCAFFQCLNLAVLEDVVDRQVLGLVGDDCAKMSIPFYMPCYKEIIFFLRLILKQMKICKN